MSDEVMIELSENVLTLSLNRPTKKNALTSSMYATLTDALSKVDASKLVRCVLIQAEGDSFTAGNDLADFTGATNASEVLSHPRRFMKALAQVNKPVVAAVQGSAVGIGTTMLLHCDAVVAAVDAKFLAPFVGLGLVPEAGSSQLLPERIGHARAFAMFALGTSLSGEEAATHGLVTLAVPSEQVRAKAREMALVLAKKPPSALRATKRLMRERVQITNVIDQEFAEFEKQLVSPEAKEAFAAFGEKRAPDFSQFG